MNNLKLIELPKFLDARGNLSVIEEMKEIPFKIERTYWIYDVPGGMHRDGHAFRQQHELIIALCYTVASVAWLVAWILQMCNR